MFMDTSSPPPIACGLTPAQLQQRREILIPGLLKRAEQVSELTNGLRLQFSYRGGLLAEITEVIEQERTCCTFLHFTLSIEPSGGAITFEITGPAGTREMLLSL
jgi:hypothetical protein